MEQQMTLQERRCDFLEALKSLSGVFPYNPMEKLSPTKTTQPSPKREITTVETSKDDEEQHENCTPKKGRSRDGSPFLSQNAMTPPLTPELSMDSDRVSDALTLLGDLAARLSDHDGGKLSPQESTRQTQV